VLDNLAPASPAVSGHLPLRVVQLRRQDQTQAPIRLAAPAQLRHKVAYTIVGPVDPIPGVGIGRANMKHAAAAGAFGNGHACNVPSGSNVIKSRGVEAAMFTAQRGGLLELPMGMNHPAARANPQFVRNLMYWLSVRQPSRPALNTDAPLSPLPNGRHRDSRTARRPKRRKAASGRAQEGVS